MRATILLICASLCVVRADTFRVGVYVPEYRMENLDENVFAAANEGYLFSVGVDPTTGTLRETSRVLTMDRKLPVAFRDPAPGFRTYLVVGGAGRSQGFPAVARSAKRRKVFARSLLKFCTRYQLYGVIIDWGGNPNMDHFHTMLRTLRSEFDEAAAEGEKALSLSVTLHHWLPLRDYSSVDYVHVLAYDIPSNAGHSTFDDATVAVRAILESGAPAEKIVFGMPLYCRALRNPGLVKSYSEILRETSGLQGDIAVHPDGQRYFCNGRETVRRKTQFARENGLGGIMFWEVGHDPADPDQSLIHYASSVSTGRPREL